MTSILKGYANSGLGQIHYRKAGNNSTYAPVILLHRCPVTSASFVPVMQKLAGWRTLIAFDIPGFGESFTPTGGTSVSEISAAILEAIGQLEIDKFHIAGHHSGCHFAAEIALKAQSSCTSLLLDGAMVACAEERAKVTPPPPNPVIERNGQYAADAWNFLLPFYTVFDAYCIHNEYVGSLASTFTRTTCMEAIKHHDMGQLLRRIKCPILASAAEDDVFESHLSRIESLVPKATIRRYGPAGIASPELRTAEFCALIQELIHLSEA